MKTTEHTPALALESVTFGYDQNTLLHNISLQINPGEVACLLGPSGCGKSTLLRLVAGFEAPRAGHIAVNGVAVADGTKSMSPQQRDVGMLFQDLALFPHLTVTQNIAYGLSDANPARVNELLSLCRIDGLKDRYPHQLSGGQQQRVALARAMAPKPALILLDEPFSSVDQGLQIDLVHEIKDMLRQDDSTVLWVTHSLSEACAVADYMGLIVHGHLVQWSSPEDFYQAPQTEAVIEFLNQGSLITGSLDQATGQFDTAMGRFDVNNANALDPELPTRVHLLNQDLVLSVDHATPNASVLASVYQGSHYQITVALSTAEQLKVAAKSPLMIGQKVHVQCMNQSLQGFQSPP